MKLGMKSRPAWRTHRPRVDRRAARERLREDQRVDGIEIAGELLTVDVQPVKLEGSVVAIVVAGRFTIPIFKALTIRVLPTTA
jgi:hypothetical protein